MDNGLLSGSKEKIAVLVGGVILVWLVYCFVPVWFCDEGDYDEKNSVVVDRRGEIFYTFPKENFTYQQSIGLAEVPELFQKLLIWKEDRNFYENYGVELKTKFKIAGFYFLTRQIERGGSTITEQWIKNKFFSGKKRTIVQKLREMTLAPFLTFATKERILEEYINHIYFGNLAYGIEAAANFYFKKRTDELNPTEQVFLISLISKPARLYEDDFNFTDEKHFYLDIALEKGWIDELAYREYRDYKIKLNFPKTRRTENIYFVEELLKEIPEGTRPEKGGLRIISTLDKTLQNSAWEKIEGMLYELREENANDVGVLVVNGKTGEVLAMIGGSDPEDERKGRINTTIQRRQIASTVKPFLFFNAFLEGVKPSQIILDKEKSFAVGGGESYTVKNYNGLEYGPVSVEQVLANSLNIGAVKILHFLGLDSFWEFQQQLGWDLAYDAEHYGLSMAIGTQEESLIKLTQGYSLFINQGLETVEPVFIKKIERVDTGEVLWENSTKRHLIRMDTEENQRVASEEVVRILSNEDLRQKSFHFNSILNDGRYLAYKTGTSFDFHDNWAIGFDEEYIVAAWVGNLDNEKMNVLSGIEGSGPILKEIIAIMDLRQERKGHKMPIDVSEGNFLFEEDREEYEEID